MDPVDKPNSDQEVATAHIEPDNGSVAGKVKFYRTRAFLIGLGVFVTLTIIFVIVLLNASSSKNTVLRTIQGRNLTQGDLDNKIDEVILPSDQDKIEKDEKLKDGILKDLTREKAVEIEAEKRGITVSEAELNAVLIPEEVNNPAAKKTHYNLLLEEKVAKAVVNNRTVDLLTSYKEPDLPNFAQLQKTTTESMLKVKNEMDQKKVDMKTAFNSQKYTTGFDTRITFKENFIVSRDTLSADTFNKISNLPEGATTDVLYDEAGTFMMIKVLVINSSPFNTFEDWLNFVVKSTDQ